VQGTPEHGGELFGRYCIGCHGVDGQGLTAPALRNPAFLDAVTDGFLQATIVRGRPGTAMRAWARGRQGFAELEPQDINDIVAHIRSWRPTP
jgi:mono/diheme cytochrome c family protein